MSLSADDYVYQERVPSVDAFGRLRERAGMTARPERGVERGLPNSLYAVVAERDGETVGMARVVGDGGTVYYVCDTAVDPDHQGRGVGTRLMEYVLDWLAAEALPGAYVNLMADVDGFYERFGFRETRPDSKGMSLRLLDSGSPAGADASDR